MPELPEVEVTRRRIEPVLVGRRIEAVETTPPSYFFVTPPTTLRRRLRGQSVSKLERLGKYLLATLSDGSGLLLHLGMTGQLFSDNVVSPRLLSATARASLSPEAQASFEIDAHTHLVLRFEDAGPAVLFRDVRKFGKVIWLPPGETHPRLARLGADALTVAGDPLFQATRRRKVAIKSLLLDQSIYQEQQNIPETVM